MSPAETIAWAALALAGTAGSALCSGLETGSYAVNRVRLGARVASGTGGKRLVLLENELARPDRLLATLLLSNNTANYCGTMGVTALLAASGLSETATVVASALLVTPLLVVFGETVPKELFRTRADKLMPALARPLAVLRVFLTAILVLPLVLVFSRFAEKISGASGSGLAGTGRIRLQQLLRESAGFGAIRSGQQDLVERALRLEGQRVGEVMTPWRHATAINATWPAERVLAELRRQPRTRVPVLDARGKPIGVAPLTALVLAGGAFPARAAVQAPVLDPAAGVRESLENLRAAGERIALVARDGRYIGVVTVADLARPLTGAAGRTGSTVNDSE